MEFVFLTFKSKTLVVFVCIGFNCCFYKQNTVYEGEYHEGHPTITTFWEVFEELTAEDKKKFLCKYCDCVSAVPVPWMIYWLNQVNVPVSSVPHRLWPRTLPGYGKHRDESHRVTQQQRTPSARSLHLSLPVVTAQLPEVPGGEDHEDQASWGHSLQRRLP